MQSLLERYLGRFVKDLGKHDLKIGLLKGTDCSSLAVAHFAERLSCVHVLTLFARYSKCLYRPRQSNIAQPRVAARCARLSRLANQHSHGLYRYSTAIYTIILPNFRNSKTHLLQSTQSNRLFDWPFVAGEIYIDIPFRSLGSEPVVVSIDRVFVVLSTKSSARVETKVDSDEQVAEAIARKIQDLKLHELKAFGQSNQV